MLKPPDFCNVLQPPEFCNVLQLGIIFRSHVTKTAEWLSQTNASTEHPLGCLCWGRALPHTCTAVPAEQLLLHQSLASQLPNGWPVESSSPVQQQCACMSWLQLWRLHVRMCSWTSTHRMWLGHDVLQVLFCFITAV